MNTGSFVVYRDGADKRAAFAAAATPRSTAQITLPDCGKQVAVHSFF
jgi:hypothetical protein